MSRGAAAASRPTAAACATAAIESGGSAADAVIAGFLGDAGADGGVLLAPAVAIVSGYGAGARAFDGRSVQPGRGAPRPRGVVAGEEAPEGARVAVPRAVAMLLLLHTYHGRNSVSSLARPGAIAAEKAGAKERASLIDRIGASGVLGLRSKDVVRAFLNAGGAVAGGTFTAADLEETRSAEAEALQTALGGGVVVAAPWPAPEATAPGAPGVAEVIVAVDGRGLAAALAYAPIEGGIALEALELTAGREAVPVRRGVARVLPGTPLAAPSPIAIFARGAGFCAAVGRRGAGAIDPLSLGTLAEGLPVERALAALLQDPSSMALAAVGDGRRERCVVVGSPG